MSYTVLIKQCAVPRRAAAVAEEVARRSGALPGDVYTALIGKSVCIKRGANEGEAMRLKEEFEAAGAEVEFAFEGTHRQPEPSADGEDFEDIPGRILTEEEFVEHLKYRPDIFTVEKDDRLRKLEAACIVAGIASGMWLTKHEVATAVAPDFYDNASKEISARVLPPQEIPGVLTTQKSEQKPVKIASPAPKKSPRPTRSIGSAEGMGGGGDVRGRATQKGVLALISGKIEGKPVASADIFGKKGFASDIDAILAGNNGLKSGGGPGAGRTGVKGIGYGDGINSGFGGESGIGVDDIIGSLLPSDGDLALARPQHKQTVLTLREPGYAPGSGILSGGRSRASIMRVVYQNISALRYAYNKRLREKPGLKGKMICKFVINEFGRIVLCEMTESTIADAQLETEVVAKISSWVFEKIDKPGDMTEVVYPFAFSQ